MHDSGSNVVSMVKSTNSRHGDNLAVGICILCRHTACRSLFAQAKMSPVLVVKPDVLVHEASQVTLVQNDHVVKQIATAVANESFSNAVLPWTAEAGSLGLDTKALDGIDDFFIKLCTAIKESKIRCSGAES
jgi:hypothetical protein